MKKIDFKKTLPYLAGILIFILIAIIYFSPLLEGKKILQQDIMNFQGGAKEIIDFRTQTGTEPLWTNSMFSGMPAYQISTKYTGNLVGFLDKIFTLGLPHPANYVFLYFIGFFILLLVLRVNPWLSIAGAIGFAFSSFFFIIIDVGHNSQAHAIGYMAPVLAGIILTLRRKYLLGGLLTAVFLSLELKANHPQITYYLVMMAFILGIAELVQALKEKRFMTYALSIGIIFIASLFALLTNITSLWATSEYGKDTIRGKSELTSEKENRTSGLDKDYATFWSYGVGETMTLLIPNFYGGTSQKLDMNSSTAKAMRTNNVPEESISQFVNQRLPMYWGAQPGTSGPVYVGAIIFFLFVLGIFVVKGPLKWWLLASTLLSVMLAWGHNFMWFTEFFMNYIPGYNKFRAVTMTLVIAEVAMPLLGILAVKELLDPVMNRKKMFKNLIIATGITGGISLIFALIPGTFLSFSGAGDASFGLPDWIIQGFRDDRMKMLRIDAFRSFVFILLAAAVLWAVLFAKIKKQYAFLILIVLILADMFPVNKRYLNDESFTTPSRVDVPFDPSPADLQILKDQDPDFRVLNLTVSTFNDASTSYFHKSIGGYHGAKFRRYQELIDNAIQQEIQVFAKTMSNWQTPALNMLNTKYIIVPDTNKTPVAVQNHHALGNAWFVNEIKVVDNPDQEIEAVKNFAPANLAIIDKRFLTEIKGFTPQRDSMDKIRLEKYLPNYLKYTSTSRNEGLAVFSEIYYDKGWKAFIDGKPSPHFRVNYVLRSMRVPAGTHEIEFRFEPSVYITGEKISLVSSIILLLLVVGGGFIEIRKTLRKEA